MTAEGPVPFTPEEEAEWDAQEAAWAAGVKDRYNAEMKQKREAAYKAEADPLFFKSQRGEISMQEWSDRVSEIRDRFPYQE
jgi:ABC-type branched-subunit amino acid transport system substrate-binding protein